MKLEDWARLAPDDWPHTPPLDVFMRLAERDGNLWWRISCGHHLNLFEEAIDRLEDCICSSGLSDFTETP